ncbi:MAG: DNA-3-methyladenine glycosylase I [Methanomassiliicoccales archaeon]|nr:DNA-3-methyladenine glycosylase I [Methanomassiliicoccales archaeon]
MKKRCAWGSTDPLLMAYHDDEWGKPVHDDDLLFEFLTLEGAQAGLSWTTILRKREGYRAAFDGFVVAKVARYDGKKIEALVHDASIIRNRRKIESTVQNAKAVIEVQKEFGSLDAYLWAFVGGKPIHGGWKELKEIPSSTAESKRMSAALVSRGFRFVGPTICYALMQAVGMANDHTVDCYRYAELIR